MKTKRKITFVVLASALMLATVVAFAQSHAAPAGHATPATAHGQAASEHGTPGEHAEHAGHHGPEPINWLNVFDTKKPAILALVINFGLLAALYYALGKKPITEGLKQRRITIGKDIEDAQKFLAEAQARAKKYQGDLAHADADAETARDAIVSSGKGDAERMLKDASERSERMQRDAELLVEQERHQVRHDIHLETIDLAVNEAEKMLARSITADDHARFANDLLTELARRPAAAAGALRAANATDSTRGAS
ncbi:MAG: ATP synthase F0 subunit B [Polyangiaceae bacterium]|nr:ATP synthase F0 subunit B [Polyangiaceae bacterium]